MSADFWAGYLSGAAGILVGNPLDIFKVQKQAGRHVELAIPVVSAINTKILFSSLVKGASAPILGYGALNALLFVSYNRALLQLDVNLVEAIDTSRTKLSKIWVAGAVGGMATWVVSAPTELIKCKAQLSSENHKSWDIARDVWKTGGFRGLYLGGGVTSIRDSLGYGFYFSSYELGKRGFTRYLGEEHVWSRVVFCGGMAGVVTWASIYPLDVVKTRLQASEELHESQRTIARRVRTGRSNVHGRGYLEIARIAYREGGSMIFFRGLGACSLRAFVVNAIQWTVYESIMQAFGPKSPSHKSNELLE